MVYQLNLNGGTNRRSKFLFAEIAEIESQWKNFIALMDAGAEDDLDEYRC